MRWLIPIVAFALLVVLGVAVYETSAQSGADKLILRDGHEMSGHLNSANEKTVRFNGKIYEHGQVKAIRLNGATGPAPEAASIDLLMKRDGSITNGAVTSVTDKLVFQNGARINRADVAIIEFANPAHVINVSPEPTPLATPTVSPTPTPSPGNLPAQESSPQPDKTNPNTSTASGPPWFNLTGCQWSLKPYVFIDGSPSGTPGKVSCRMWVNVCGTVIERKKVIDSKERCWLSADLSRPEICCDIWNKYVNNPDSQWNPKKDADGDGIPNDQDDDPLGPQRPK